MPGIAAHRPATTAVASTRQVTSGFRFVCADDIQVILERFADQSGVLANLPAASPWPRSAQPVPRTAGQHVVTLAIRDCRFAISIGNQQLAISNQPCGSERN